MIAVCELCGLGVFHDDAHWFAPATGEYAHAACAEEDPWLDPDDFAVVLP